MTFALGHRQSTRLGYAIAPLVAANPGSTGIHAIPDPRAAFAARVVLAAAADRTLDVQYYIWHADETGFLLFQALWEAAGRGVRVRLLLDDNNTAGLDPTLAALDAHPNIEIRLYNPLRFRRLRALNYLTEFRRLNRRMHNKSFTADNVATIVGGRNVGNEYFAKGTGVGFRDLDVLAVGPVVADVSSAFERYWTSPSARPAPDLLRRPRPDATAALEAAFERARGDPDSRIYLDSLRETKLVHALLDGDLPLEWTGARLYCDDPAKTLDTRRRTDILLLPALLEAIGHPERSFDLVSPYLVPGEDGTAVLTGLARRGVRVRILTNSLAATDVAAVHSGYARRRPALLRAGVWLYELKPSALQDAPEARGSYGGSSSASLHAKTFALDHRRVFVGSFNFDPRSALLNTEMGLLIESPALAERLANGFDTAVPNVAYEVRLGPDGRALEWIEQTQSGSTRYVTEPASGILRRTMVRLLSTLPIEWML
jgi:phosphatidylserine/phosphatidylglycerophosphate/cardiolipin synthase-like enzyme